MKKINVNLKKKSYDIFVGSGAVRRLPKFLKTMEFSGPVVMITDKTVALKTSKIIGPVLESIPNDILRVVLPPSEKSKSIEVFQDTIQKISKKTKTHRPVILAVGGGVVGDLAGFVAATYRRGVPLIQIPTTLLAQVDSAIGGKVGIDIPEAKNFIGAFWQPKIVLIDTDFLTSLPIRQVRNGLGEVIKYGVIKKGGFFEFLEDNIEDILALKKNVLEKVIFKCVSIKADIVAKDEFDVKDIRIILNFGHTLGHAVEAASGYSKSLNHGESVALGMVIASEIAYKLDMLEKKSLDRIKKLIKKAGLPVKLKGMLVEDIMKAYSYDKKFTKGANRFVFPNEIGSVEIIEAIPELPIRSALSEYVE
ncbi:MAG: 3-dehydroquinate synthase [Candidatus Omnitrophica bacterium]|nr:3-dehydroquinate synthase [Candidatus Omnitrophota bacterium]